MGDSLDAETFDDWAVVASGAPADLDGRAARPAAPRVNEY
jgi:hypothetical protein